LDSFLIFCSGFTFAIGGINFIIGFKGKDLISYLYFGILSLAASFFLLAQIPPLYDSVYPDLSNTISIITATIFYSFILLFTGEFTSIKSKGFTVTFLVLISILLLTYFFISDNTFYDKVWSFFAHLLIFSLGIYGIIGGIRGRKNLNIIWQFTFLILMTILSILALLVGIDSIFGIPIIPDPAGFISPLDFFPVLFTVIIGYKMGHDIIRSYQLESEVKLKNKQWSALMESINLLVVQLNPKGRIIWVNQHFLQFTGYSMKEVAGENWFDKVLPKESGQALKQQFQDFIQGESIPVYLNPIRIKDGAFKNIQWSNIHIQDAKGKIIGSLSIGTDVTERESALAEIKKLKDQLEKENLQLREEVEFGNHSKDIIGQSDALKYVMKRAQQVADTNSTVLLEGETGVGKELFANLIHQNSARRHKPFIKVNCASLPKELIESELFGHMKGSFTGAISNRQGRFELADRGTIFLDEIGELPIDLQPKLLRVLQTGEFERIGSEKTTKVDVRIITATNRDLEKESDEGKFRKDLYFRLNVYPITIPPLRQRKEDITLLVRHFTNKIGQKVGKRIKHISKADIKMLEEYSWPGNIRELENIIERAIINSSGEKLEIDKSQLQSSLTRDQVKQDHENTTYLKVTEKNHITNILESCDWKINGKSGAAEKLGMPPSTLRSKMKKLNITRPE
jgi:PAS domain S-box-containing protein